MLDSQPKSAAWAHNWRSATRLSFRLCCTPNRDPCKVQLVGPRLQNTWSGAGYTDRSSKRHRGLLNKDKQTAEVVATHASRYRTPTRVILLRSPTYIGSRCMDSDTTETCRTEYRLWLSAGIRSFRRHFECRQRNRHRILCLRAIQPAPYCASSFVSGDP